jgi:hypothetical protein
MQIIDPRAGRKYQAETHDWQMGGVTIEQAANASPGQAAYNTEISFMFEPIEDGYAGDGRTVLKVNNYACLPLPDFWGWSRTFMTNYAQTSQRSPLRPWLTWLGHIV